jgi:phosphoribosylpyrophosphate synthetase
VWIAAAHPLFLPDAVGTLAGAAVERILVTDSVPVAAEVAAQLPLATLALGPYLGAVLDRVWRGGSVSELAGLPE